MPSSYPAPTEQTVEALLGGLVSIPAHVARAPLSDRDLEAPGALVEFVNDDNHLAAIALADHDVVNYLGGPVAGVELAEISEASGNQTMLEASLEGFRQVAQSLATCFNTDYTMPVRFRELHELPGELSTGVQQLFEQPGGRRAFKITVDEYGEGSVTLFLA